ncbi:mitochondrial S-adenosylmethionine carrier protein isoform X1 [Denticeps clupeoides]|uniref:S-adenosylmethionine mitochondrial carrier protein-like isoform X1 n=1 Tax=Denticeps clupeoides TaxID=299321 RepID=UPI0010A3B845|nr:S-adenosylmethionine mitochondrial carrier protein-like isoform X1 [Denticeps clupeoides]XP_028855385.1 S-adenosylmethionine mitochondrial carrier protein isoform X1 [Denticeps clupeoides]
MDRREFTASLLAGGCAGMCVDLALFPLDTIKTRLQSQQGFQKAGGFRGIYAGVPSAAAGSFPSAAAFFVTYETSKTLFGDFMAAPMAPVSHMMAASLGEVVACLVRVPTEVVKQRTQASPSTNTYRVLLSTLREEGLRGLYRGYGSTVLREIPFSLVQFPLWEYLKSLWSWREGRPVHSWQAALCGAFAGGEDYVDPWETGRGRSVLDSRSIPAGRPIGRCHSRLIGCCIENVVRLKAELQGTVSGDGVHPSCLTSCAGFHAGPIIQSG